MTKETVARAVTIGAAGLACFMTSLPANASLPGNGYSFWEWGVTQYSRLDLGSTPYDSTCFLSGIDGTLYVGGGVQIIQAEVNGETHWMLEVSPGQYSVELGGRATCLYTTPSAYKDLQGPGSTVIAPTAPGRECFLQGIDESGAWFYDGAAVDVSISGSNWVLAAAGVGSDTVTQAVCVDMPGGYYYYRENHYTGTYTVPWTETSSNPIACGIRGISGAFQGNWGDGVDMNEPTDPGHWTMTATANSKYGWFTCLE